MKELDDLLDNVNSKKTFLEFVRALAEDRAEEEELEAQSTSSPYSPGANGWENGSISAYLDAIQRCVSAPANSKDFSEQANWKTFAKILYVGKYYE